MLTGQGWLLALVGVVSVAAGRLLGSVELYVVGAVSFAALCCAVVYVLARRVRLDVRRHLHPARPQQGMACRVGLAVTNHSRRSSPLLELSESTSRGARAVLGVPPLRRGEAVELAYGLDTRRRGLVRLGPASAVLSDPVGLARVRIPATGHEDITIYPRIYPVPAAPHTTGADPLAGAEHPNALGHGGEDFYSLRAYVVGDDLRRVHWPSTARHDDLMVRQDEMPWQGRVTVLLDNRGRSHTEESFESAVSAAASLIEASARRGDMVRLITTDGMDSGVSAGGAHHEAVMERLATVELSHDAVYQRVLRHLGRSTGAGALIVLTSDATASSDLNLFLGLRSRFAPVRLIRFATGSASAAASATAAVADAADAADFAAAWTAALGRRATVGSPR